MIAMDEENQAIQIMLQVNDKQLNINIKSNELKMEIQEVEYYSSHYFIVLY